MSSLRPQAQIISLEQYEVPLEDVRAEMFEGRCSKYWIVDPKRWMVTVDYFEGEFIYHQGKHI